MKKIFNNRFGGIILFAFVFLCISFLIRTVLLIYSFEELELTFFSFFGIYMYGIFYDLVAISYFIIPFAIYLLVIPDKVFNHSIHKWIAYAFFIISIGILVFSAIGEWFFWNEFNVRYNFIAVDYLVYTHEVIGNIKESYPMPLVITGMLFFSAFIGLAVRRYFDICLQSTSNFVLRSKLVIVLLAIPLFSYFFITDSTAEIKSNSYANELAHDGIYQIFSAFLNNELDYNTFYKTLNDEEVFENIRNLLSTEDSKFSNENPYDISRKISNNGQIEKHHNIMIITVESLSASFLTKFGQTENITPNLDTLIDNSLLFSNFYATGTRTVRGMEALVLSLPPTPGYSIVKRPHNENMFSLGAVLKSKGYENHFIYAGHGYFDNMNYFFGNNGYQIIDRADFKDEEISFENAWGVCDEDLLDKALYTSQEMYKQGKAFSNFIMTTSNHRPYTYPSGKIDIPSHTGRKGAVKYTDYAIGQFLKKAKTYEWFDNTIFIIVADHCASSAGKTSLPINKYHIPLIIYAPKIFPAKDVSSLASQIDFAPTVLGLLNMNYTSKFFGKDIINENPNRALIGTYQKIGLLKNENLTVQKPTKLVESYRITPDGQIESPLIQQDLQESITYYQAASYLFKNGGYKYSE
tara:strand:+ start:3356 stop:5263 length:1908 start_codon:yes stop_codon:yes gene_type:complete